MSTNKNTNHQSASVGKAQRRAWVTPKLHRLPVSATESGNVSTTTSEGALTVGLANTYDNTLIS